MIDRIGRSTILDPPRGDEPPARVGRVFANPTVPTTTRKYFAMHPVDVLGTETEGGTGSKTVDATKTFYAFVVGTTAPVAGDDLVCRFVGHRWVAECCASASGITLGGCPCAGIATTLHLDAPAPGGHPYVDADLTWQAIPANVTGPNTAGVIIGTEGFFSAVLTNPIYSPPINNIQTYRWYLRCLSGYYSLYFLVVTDSALGGSVPYVWTGTFIDRYIIGGANTCSPFSLSSSSGGSPSSPSGIRIDQ